MLGKVNVNVPDATGNAKPIRKLHVTHRAYAMAMDEEYQEFFVSVQHPPQVAVYRRGAEGDEQPKRLRGQDATFGFARDGD